MGSRKLRINPQCVSEETSIQLNRHFHFIEVHHIVRIPDDAVIFLLFKAYSYDVFIPVFLDSKPLPVIPVLNIILTMPVNTVNNILFIRTALIPVYDKPDEAILC